MASGRSTVGATTAPGPQPEPQPEPRPAFQFGNMLFKLGDQVKLQALGTRVDLNSQHGAIRSSQQANGRWPVRLNNGESVRVRPANLVPCALAEAYAAAEAIHDQEEMGRIRQLAAAADMVAYDTRTHLVSVDKGGEYTIMHGSRIPIYLPAGVTPIVEATERDEVLTASRARILVWPATAAGFLLDGTDDQVHFVHSHAVEVGLDPSRLASVVGDGAFLGMMGAEECCKLGSDRNRAAALADAHDEYEDQILLRAETLYSQSKYLETELEIQAVLGSPVCDTGLQARCLMLRGRVMYRQAGQTDAGRLRAALGVLEEAERLLPEDDFLHRAELLNSKGMVYNQICDLAAAQKTLERALRLCNAHHLRNGLEAMIRSNLADAVTAAGKLDEAIEHLRQAIQLTGPGYPCGLKHAKLAGIYSSRGEAELAFEHYELAVSFPGSQPVMKCQWCRTLSALYAAQVYAADQPDTVSQERFDKAMEQLTLGIQLAHAVTGMQPAFAKDFRAEICGMLAKRLLAMLLLATAKTAAFEMNPMDKKAPKDRRLGATQYKQIRRNVDRILKEAGGSAASISCLCDCVMVHVCVLEADFETAVKYGESFLSAVERGTKIEAHERITFDVRRTLCQACMNLSRHPAAKVHIDAALLLCQRKPGPAFLDAPGDTSLLSALETAGNLSCRMGDYDQAEKYQTQEMVLLEAALEHQASHPAQTSFLERMQATVLNNLGTTFNSKGDCVKAADFFKKSEKIATQFEQSDLAERARANLATVETSLGSPAEALQTFQQQLDKGDLPVNEKVRILSIMGQTYVGLGQKSAAVDCYTKARILAAEVDDREPEAGILMLIRNVEPDFKCCWEYYEQASDIADGIPGAASLQARIIGNKACRLSGQVCESVHTGSRGEDGINAMFNLQRCEKLHRDAISRAKKLGDKVFLGERQTDYSFHVDFCKSIGHGNICIWNADQLRQDSMRNTEPGTSTRAEVLLSLAQSDANAQKFESGAKHSAECIDILTAHRDGLPDDHKVSVFAHKHSKAFDIFIFCLTKLSRHGEALNAAERSRSSALTDLVAEMDSVWTHKQSCVLARSLDAELVYYYLDSSLSVTQTLYIWVVTRDGELHFRESAVGLGCIPNIDVMMGAFGKWRSYRCISSPSETGRDASSTAECARIRSTLASLSALLIDPIRNLLTQDGRVVFFPHNELFFTPFAALRSTGEQSRHLVDDYIIHVGVSMRLMAIVQESAQSGEAMNGANGLVVGYPHDDTICAIPQLETDTSRVTGWSELRDRHCPTLSWRLTPSESCWVAQLLWVHQQRKKPC